MLYEERHFIISFLVSLSVPVIGSVIILAAGYWHERRSHDGMIPDDLDTQQDLADDVLGTVLGCALGLVLIAIHIHPLLLLV